MKRITIYIVILTLWLMSCTNSDFLDAVPDNGLVIPARLDDYQAMLDNDRFMNGSASTGYGVTPALGEMGADDYTLTETFMNSSIIDNEYVNVYTWQKDIFERTGIHDDWTEPYVSIFYANSALKGVEQIGYNEKDKAKFENIKGSALFYRAHAFYQLAQIFAPPYPLDGNASSLMGIPLRLESDINEHLERSDLETTYQQITNDLQTASQLLPDVPLYKTRPSKAAAYGLLARTYLIMHQYEKAFSYADSALQITGYLLDYNDELAKKDAQSEYSFVDYRANSEILFYSLMVQNNALLIAPFNSFITAKLYDSYEDDDLRKVLFFSTKDGGPAFWGGYSGYYFQFTGIAVDELFLIRAECYARLGRIDQAMDNLNSLLEKRYKEGTFLKITETNAEAALKRILNERRKELVMRGLRWTDLRRLNQENANITIYREFRGQTYNLSPKDPKYTYPIPPAIIGFNPNWPQNKR